MLNTINPVAPVAIVATDLNAVSLVHTYINLGERTKFHAEDFQLWLSVEKGYSSKMRVTRKGWRVIASDGQAVDFLK
jgi:hypothetical protein